MFNRQELVDLSKDTAESRLCVRIAGLSLVPGPITTQRVTINDKTPGGSDSIKELINKGFRVESLKD